MNALQIQELLNDTDKYLRRFQYKLFEISDFIFSVPNIHVYINKNNNFLKEKGIKQS